MREGVAGSERPFGPGLPNGLEKSPVDSFAIDYIIHSDAAPENEPSEGGVPVMRVSIIVSASFSGSVTALRRH